MASAKLEVPLGATDKESGGEKWSQSASGSGWTVRNVRGEHEFLIPSGKANSHLHGASALPDAFTSRFGGFPPEKCASHHNYYVGFLVWVLNELGVSWFPHIVKYMLYT